MESVQKLTKKQKKGIAFRSRKGKPSKKDEALASQDCPETLDIPIMEDQDAAGLENRNDEGQEEDVRSAVPKAKGLGSHGKDKDKGKAENVAAKKRKRTEENVEAEEMKRKKKRKSDGGDVEGREGKGEGKDKAMSGEGKNSKTQRFILFLGNIKYTTTKEAIQEHFSKCDPPPTIRLLTPKPSAYRKTTTKSKGCAFLEFTHRNALQQALKLHQSMLDGRMVNVELTAGGGGNGEKRIEKLKQRNKELLGQRKDRVKKSDDKTIPTLPDKPQRFSSTSGIDQAPTNKRTWTVGDVEEDGKTHRGGKKHKKERRPKRPQVTGVNAIPVG